MGGLGGQDQLKSQKGEELGLQGSPLDAPKLEPKLIKICINSNPKGDHFFDHSLDRLLERFGANLAPTPPQNLSKMEPSWHPNRIPKRSYVKIA